MIDCWRAGTSSISRVRAVRGGVTSVQLRLKQASARGAGRPRRRALRRGAPGAGAGERPARCRAGGRVRSAPGPGGSAGGAGAADPAERERSSGRRSGRPEERTGRAGADYWGVGPWRVTGTKGTPARRSGPRDSGSVVALAGGRPCIAIGAVRPEDVPEVLAAGGAGVAVVSGILGADDVEAAARGYAVSGQAIEARRRSGSLAALGRGTRRYLACRPSPHLFDRPIVFHQRPAEDVMPVRPGHEVEAGHLGGIERGLDAPDAG